MEKDAFDNDGLIARSSGKWAEEKLFYLKRYIDVFETSMRSKFNIRFYIELFAGPGRNYIRETHTYIDGSPLIALSTTSPFSNYVFIEKNTIYLDALKSRCYARFPKCHISYLNGDCNNEVDKILSSPAINSGLNLTFIDPEGFEVKWHTIEKLASIKRNDMIINYPEGGLNRQIKKCFLSGDSCCLDEYFGSADWKTIYDDYQKKKIPNLHRGLIDFLMGKLTKLGYISIKDFQINQEPLIRNTRRNAPQYRLIFASKHDLGNNFWKKITKKDNSGQESLPF